MYIISVREHFDAAHFLRDYQGKCEKLHGHRFEVVAKVEAIETNKIGLAYDFAELRTHLTEVLRGFDHICLNDRQPFDTINPSSENIASTIYRELRNRIGAEPVSLHSVEVWESPDSGVAYSPEKRDDKPIVPETMGN